MLSAALPYRDFKVGYDEVPPKIISELRKSYVNLTAGSRSLNFKPKLTGDLLLKFGNEKKWWPRRVQVRGGQLHVSTPTAARGEEGPGPPPLRLPLRHMSLQAGPLPNSLSLCRGQHILLALQTSNEKTFDEWVKAIAVELIRQTPLEAVKYLDILTIARCWKRRDENPEKDCNFNVNNNETDAKDCDSCKSRQTTKTAHKTEREEEIVVETIKEQAKCAADIMKKCQKAEDYVPVKEKLFLFESLSKYGRKVRSTEDVSRRTETGANKRARSLHDLSNLNGHIAVREICKYFEQKCDFIEENERNVSNYNKRLVQIGKETDVYKFRKVITT